MATDVQHRYRLVGEWLWEYDGDDKMPMRMFWVSPENRHFYAPTQHGPPKPNWCRMPHCLNDTFGTFCEMHAVEGNPADE